YDRQLGDRRFLPHTPGSRTHGQLERPGDALRADGRRRSFAGRRLPRAVRLRRGGAARAARGRTRAQRSQPVTRTRRLGVVMDPIGSIKPYKDSTLAMLLEGQRRGWEIRYMEPQDLFLRGPEPFARTC